VENFSSQFFQTIFHSSVIFVFSQSLSAFCCFFCISDSGIFFLDSCFSLFWCLELLVNLSMAIDKFSGEICETLGLTLYSNLVVQFSHLILFISINHNFSKSDASSTEIFELIFPFSILITSSFPLESSLS
jgi:hypothetical protein